MFLKTKFESIIFHGSRSVVSCLSEVRGLIVSDKCRHYIGLIKINSGFKGITIKNMATKSDINIPIFDGTDYTN